MTAPVHTLTVEQIRRLRADAPHFAPDNDIPVQMLCDMALALLEERDDARRKLLDLLVQVSLLRDYFNIAREALATATNWATKGAKEADAAWQARPKDSP